MKKKGKQNEGLRCYACGAELPGETVYPMCDKCEREGWFLDVMGVLHSPGSDPAAAYE